MGKIVILQFLVLLVSLGCIYYADIYDKDLSEVLYGFGLWGYIPNILLMFVVISISLNRRKNSQCG